MGILKASLAGIAIGFAIIFTTAWLNWHKIGVFVTCHQLDICKDYGPDP